VARSRFVVEVAGPAGSGKTTVTQLLSARPHVVSASVWRLPKPLYAASAVRALPAIGALVGASRWIPWEETEQLIRLEALDVFLSGLLERGNGHRVVVLDEGPVFALAWFRVLGHACFRDGRCDGWWRRVLAHWAARLDEFAADYRHAFEWVIAGMTSGENAPKIITLESNGTPPAELADRVLAACQETVRAE